LKEFCCLWHNFGSWHSYKSHGTLYHSCRISWVLIISNPYIWTSDDVSSNWKGRFKDNDSDKINLIKEFMIMQHKPKKCTLFSNLIQFLTSSTGFEPHGFIIRTTVCTRIFCILYFSCIYVGSPVDGRVCYVSFEDLHVLN
jgi:hypothetical protein